MNKIQLEISRIFYTQSHTAIRKVYNVVIESNLIYADVMTSTGRQVGAAITTVIKELNE